MHPVITSYPVLPSDILLSASVAYTGWSLLSPHLVLFNGPLIRTYRLGLQNSLLSSVLAAFAGNDNNGDIVQV